jgi:hypothetical protein
MMVVRSLQQQQQQQAAAVVNDNNNDKSDSMRKQQQLYLEARLGAKAILTGKVGGGSTGRVYTLATLQVPGCLEDLDWWYASQSQSQRSSTSITTKTKRGSRLVVSELCRDFYESLAAVVEFDGLETLQDPSPRSSLMLQQYNNDKDIYVFRMLNERVIPIGQQLVQAFDPEVVQFCQAYIQEKYASEIPPPLQLQQQEQQQEKVV